MDSALDSAAKPVGRLKKYLCCQSSFFEMLLLFVHSVVAGILKKMLEAKHFSRSS